MAIKLMPDLGAPALVFVADWATSTYDEKATGFKLNRPIGILLAVGGYAGGMFGWGGDFVKNIGIASFDWAANSIVGYIKEKTAPTSARVTSTRVPVQRLAPSYAGRPVGESRVVYPTPTEEVQVTVT
jgi:hypothetical protein